MRPRYIVAPGSRFDPRLSKQFIQRVGSLLDYLLSAGLLVQRPAVCLAEAGQGGRVDQVVGSLTFQRQNRWM